MHGAGITSVTAALAPRPGARGQGTDPARGAGEAPPHVPEAETAAAKADARPGGALTQPAVGPEGARGLALSQTPAAASPDGLSADEQNLVRRMAARDREVRQHEQAHARAGGSHAGSPTFSYQIGPDGRRYATGGAVAIDTAPVRDNPEATIAKMQVVKDAALAPASPSMADRRIAAQAEATRLAAIAELAASRRDALEQPEDAPGVTGRLFTQLDRPEPGDELSRAV
ncbi:MAG: hypothetical protein IID49_02015 [Proteobacteria bacterium]|nr:hypothetical protein [Pseudomonadota bacterium]MCH8950887.1 hypothetical protein [Pseudomonadota bacterium]